VTIHVDLQASLVPCPEVGLEQILLLFFTDADSVVCHIYTSNNLTTVKLNYIELDTDAVVVLRKFDGVGQQIYQHLLDSQLIHLQLEFFQGVIRSKNDPNVSEVSLTLKNLDYFVNNLAQIFRGKLRHKVSILKQAFVKQETNLTQQEGGGSDDQFTLVLQVV